jgi:hypothetical protein
MRGNTCGIILAASLLTGMGAARAAALDSAIAAAEAADPSGLYAGIDLALDIDYRYRSADELVEPYQDKSGIDLMRDFFDLPPFASFRLDVGSPTGLGAAIGGDIRRELATIGFFDDSNLPIDGTAGYAIAFERPFVSLGALWWKSPDFDVELGRDKVHYGDDLEGSIYPSARLPYLDALQTRWNIGPFKLEWMVSTMDAVESYDGIDVNPNEGLNPADYPDAGEDPSLEAPDMPYGFFDDPNPTVIVEELHRFSWNFGKLEIGTGSNMLIARRNNYIQLTDFLPFSSWHQTQILSNNLTVYLDATWKPYDCLTVAAEGGLDDFNANSIGIPDSGVPTIPALVVGARYADSFAPGKVSAYFEAGYTHYLWGNFSGTSDAPYDEDPLAREQYRFLVVNGSALLPLTSPYGPGAMWLSAKGSLALAGSGLEIGADILVLSKNTEANLIDTPYAADPAVANAPRILFVSASVPVSYRMGSFTIYAEPDLCSRDGTVWFECSLGGRLELQVAKKIADAR